MQKSYKSIDFQMGYSFVSGISLLVAPNFFIGLIGFAPTQEIWIKAIGLMALMLCFYYYNIARSSSYQAVLGTVYGRWFFSSVVIGIALLGVIPKFVILAMIFESGLALWSWREIRA